MPRDSISTSQLPMGWEIIPQGDRWLAVNEVAKLCTCAFPNQSDAIREANRYYAKPKQHPATVVPAGICVVRADGVRFRLIA